MTFHSLVSSGHFFIHHRSLTTHPSGIGFVPTLTATTALDSGTKLFLDKKKMSQETRAVHSLVDPTPSSLKIPQKREHMAPDRNWVSKFTAKCWRLTKTCAFQRQNETPG